MKPVNLSLKRADFSVMVSIMPLVVTNSICKVINLYFLFLQTSGENEALN